MIASFPENLHLVSRLSPDIQDIFLERNRRKVLRRSLLINLHQTYIGLRLCVDLWCKYQSLNFVMSVPMVYYRKFLVNQKIVIDHWQNARPSIIPDLQHGRVVCEKPSSPSYNCKLHSSLTPTVVVMTVHVYLGSFGGLRCTVGCPRANRVTVCSNTRFRWTKTDRHRVLLSLLAFCGLGLLASGLSMVGTGKPKPSHHTLRSRQN